MLFSRHTISSYLSVISHTIAMLSFLSTDQTRYRPFHLASKFDPISTSWPLFALFDSKLDQLYLPILRPPSDSQSEGDADHQSHREESVLHHAQKYFECVATFSQGTHPFSLSISRRSTEFVVGLSTSASDDSRGVRKKLIIYYGGSGDTVTTWEWSEVLQQPRGSAEKHSTSFVWSHSIS